MSHIDTTTTTTTKREEPSAKLYLVLYVDCQQRKTARIFKMTKCVTPLSSFQWPPAFFKHSNAEMDKRPHSFQTPVRVRFLFYNSIEKPFASNSNSDSSWSLLIISSIVAINNKKTLTNSEEAGCNGKPKVKKKKKRTLRFDVLGAMKTLFFPSEKKSYEEKSIRKHFRGRTREGNL